MITKTNQSLSEIFDVKPVGQIIDVKPDNQQVSIRTTAVEVDIEIARTAITSALDLAGHVASNAAMIANGNEDSKSFDSVAKLLSTIGDLSDKLVNIHPKKQQIPLQQPPINNTEGTTINGPVFVGSTTEFAKMIANIKHQTE